MIISKDWSEIDSSTLLIISRLGLEGMGEVVIINVVEHGISSCKKLTAIQRKCKMFIVFDMDVYLTSVIIGACTVGVPILLERGIKFQFKVTIIAIYICRWSLAYPSRKNA